MAGIHVEGDAGKGADILTLVLGGREGRAPVRRVLPRSLPRADELAVVGLRVDGLTIAAVVGLDPSRLRAWRAIGPDAGQEGVLPVPIWDGSAVELAVRRLRGEGRWYAENGDLRAIIDEKPLAGAQLEVTFAATFLATNGVQTAVAYVEAIAAQLGVVLELRTRRLDLAADVAGWAITAADRACWKKPGRAGLTLHGRLDPLDLDAPELVKEHLSGGVVTGYTVGGGGPVLLRVYDKRRELAEQSPEKLALEEAIWRGNGWRGGSPVTRVEFQLRSEALRSFGIVAPYDLEEQLDGIWQYLVQRWVRLVEPGRSRLSRCASCPRWALLERVQFFHAAEPAVRSYVRGGARLVQALGCLVSYAAHAGLPLRVPPASAAVELPAEALRQTLEELMAQVARLAVAELVNEQGGAAAALDWLRERLVLTLARTSTVGGGAEPPWGRDRVAAA